MPLAVDRVILVHGYSATQLIYYGGLPALLAQQGVSTNQIVLSAFVSLDDQVSCDDIAQGLEKQIAELEANGLNLRKTAVITHSTGAIVARRWILNRVRSGATLPLHFISMAGANHGSTLAQLGRTFLAKVYRWVAEGSDVGARVLADLDYGSVFLHTLNMEWLTESNKGAASALSQVYSFSMIGADHSFWRNHLTWQAHETGSDGTVRISGGNLNYRRISVALMPDGSLVPQIETLKQPVPHLVVDVPPNQRYSHMSSSEPDVQGLVISAASGIINSFTNRAGLTEPITENVRGILDGLSAPTDIPFQALVQAMSVNDAASYQAVVADWTARTDAWSNQKGPDGTNPQVDSTIVVTIGDQEGSPIAHSLITIKDQNFNMKAVSTAIEPYQPIVNALSPSTLSFYVNTDTWLKSHPHYVDVEVNSATSYVTYNGIRNAPISGNFNAVVANQTTYIDLQMLRDAAGTYKMYLDSDPNLPNILKKTFPPFP